MTRRAKMPSVTFPATLETPVRHELEHLCAQLQGLVDSLPAPPEGAVQFYDGGEFGGSADFVWDDFLTVSGDGGGDFGGSPINQLITSGGTPWHLVLRRSDQAAGNGVGFFVDTNVLEVGDESMAFLYDVATGVLTLGESVGSGGAVGGLYAKGDGFGSSFGSPHNVLIESTDISPWALVLRRSDLGANSDVSIYNGGDANAGALWINGSGANATWTLWGDDGLTAVPYIGFTPPFGNYTFNTLPTATASHGLPYALAVVTDSDTDVWGDVVAGGGGFTVLAFYNGADWTVAAK